ncbi:hypothetical protein F5X99DRAFT_421707 [Biscogniauxia marginata]|nr:hypothetical protein F5X99DRAFT_421707 [Biscogniauxia marginata]
MERPPFDEQQELCRTLTIRQEDGNPAIQRTSSSIQAGPVNLEPITKKYLPGVPHIQLGDPDICNYLKSELVTNDLDRLSPRLCLVAKQDSSHISSLTEQTVRGRNIVVTENPGLHLVWYYDRIFIKPLPKYLLSHAFWEYYLISTSSPIPEDLRHGLKKAALGFLRSYSRLIRHKSDFLLAQDGSHRLLPHKIKYANFVRLIEPFETMHDGAVSPRYHFGELRLSRLNFWSKVFLSRLVYHKVDGQYGAYFAGFFAPILFVFGVFSVLLGAMQVVLAVQSLVESDASWEVFARVSRGFSVFTVFFTACTILFLLGLLATMWLRELVFALKDLYGLGHKTAD